MRTIDAKFRLLVPLGKYKPGKIFECCGGLISGVEGVMFRDSTVFEPVDILKEDGSVMNPSSSKKKRPPKKDAQYIQLIDGFLSRCDSGLEKLPLYYGKSGKVVGKKSRDWMIQRLETTQSVLEKTIKTLKESYEQQ